METKRVLPKVLVSRYDAGGNRYIGSFQECVFDGSSIEGRAMFSVYEIGEQGGTKPTAKSPIQYKRKIVDFSGKAYSDRNMGYKSQIVGDMANSGLVIPDDVLNGVFDPMEATLIGIHRKVFPPEVVEDPKKAWEEAKKARRAKWEAEDKATKEKMEAALGLLPKGGGEAENVFIEGEIKTAGQTTVGHFDEPVTIYTLNMGGQIRRIGVRGYCKLLAPGDLIRAEVIDGEVICRITRQEYFEVLHGEFQVVETEEEYLKMIGWKKLDSATSQESEKSKEKREK
ncbi:MAG: hypothetical protein HY512_00590 [Candidatus Aenigmarchaeota archaeon]|nr:hypothetical protein [Candidatus Aenigmarchaeota archaeon]